MRYVKSVGPLSAEIALVGEAPGAEEEARGEPFVGKSGRFLNLLLAKAGIAREGLYITNVAKVRPPANDFGRLEETGVTLAECIAELRAELSALRSLKVIVAVGGVALHALTGLTEPLLRRGSVYELALGERRIPVLCLLHPRFVSQQPTYFRPTVWDLDRAQQIAHGAPYRPPEHHIVLDPSLEDWQGFIERIADGAVLVCDLEVPKKLRDIAVVGLADSPTAGIVLPFMGSSKLNEWTVKDELQALLRRTKLVFQNGPFDIYWLNHSGYDVPVENYHADTMFLHNLLWPELPHALHFISSVYTLEPYYKSEGKEWQERAGWPALWAYNAKDLTTTYASFEAMRMEAEATGAADYFWEREMPLVRTLVTLGATGIAVDKEAQKKAKKDGKALKEAAVEDVQRALKEEYEQKRLGVIVPIATTKVRTIRKSDPIPPLEVNLNSPEQVGVLLYDILRYPERLSKEGGRTVDKDALLSFATSALYGKRPIFRALLRYRNVAKTLSTFIAFKTSTDGRMRSRYRIVETGRLSSAKYHDETGGNMQNRPRIIKTFGGLDPKICRALFVPDGGYRLFGADLSQCESHYVAWRAQETWQLEAIEAGISIHKAVAKMIFGRDVSKEEAEYDVVKRGVHGTHYGMADKKLQKTVQESLDERNIDMIFTLEDARRFRIQYLAVSPRIAQWQRDVRERVFATNVLYNAFGRRHVFVGPPGDDSVWRQALAFDPQSSVADLVNQALRRSMHRWKEEKLDAAMLIQVHDQLVWQARPKSAARATEIVLEELRATVPGGLFGLSDLHFRVEAKEGADWAEVC